MWVLTTFSIDVSRLGEVTQPANAHINLSCSLQKQFILRNDFIISERFTESHNTSPLSDSHSVLVLQRQFTLPVSQDVRTCMQKERKKERGRVGERCMAGATKHFSLFKKCRTNCMRSLPRFKSLTSKQVILDPNTNSSLKIHAHHEVKLFQCAAEVQLQFRFTLSLFGQTEEPWGEQMETKMRLKFGDELSVLVQCARPAAAKTWGDQNPKNREQPPQERSLEMTYSQSKKNKSKNKDWTGFLFRYRIWITL